MLLRLLFAFHSERVKLPANDELNIWCFQSRALSLASIGSQWWESAVQWKSAFIVVWPCGKPVFRILSTANRGRMSVLVVFQNARRKIIKNACSSRSNQHWKSHAENIEFAWWNLQHGAFDIPLSPFFVSLKLYDHHWFSIDTNTMLRSWARVR